MEVTVSDEELVQEYVDYINLKEREERSRTGRKIDPLSILCRRANMTRTLPFEDYKMGIRLSWTSGYYESRNLDSAKDKEARDNEDFIHTKYGYCYYAIEDGVYMIYNLFVEPIYRKIGHAKSLIIWVIHRIRETGYNGEIQIEARPRDNSIDYEELVSFYKRMGLTVINSSPEDKETTQNS